MMKQWTKRVFATLLSAVLLLGCIGTAWAIDGDSGFASTGGADSTNGVTQFYLIKDYDSIYATSGGPYSISPAETFTYTITPYHVWNAGNTSATSTTPISAADMPMLEAPASPASGTTYTPSGTGTGRKLVITQNVAKGAAKYNTENETESFSQDTKSLIVLPTYTTVGDYWYMVQEKIGVNGNRTTGVFYGSNDAVDEVRKNANGSHTATYYVHVQVTQGDSKLVSNVTLHKTAPNINLDDNIYNSQKDDTYAVLNKVNAIQNSYFAGQLRVKKTVSGSGGDTTQYFKVRVTFTKPAGTVINSDIAINNAYYLDTTNNTYITNNNKTIPGQYENGSSVPTATEFVWNKAANDTSEAKAVAVFYVTNNTTVTFSNIPFGINYTVEEYQPEDTDYRNSFKMTRDTADLLYSFNGNVDSSGNATLTQDVHMEGHHFCGENTTDIGAQGSVTGAIGDLVTINNQKEFEIDIGVITENAPFIAMLTVAGAAVVLLFARKKKYSEV